MYHYLLHVYCLFICLLFIKAKQLAPFTSFTWQFTAFLCLWFVTNVSCTTVLSSLQCSVQSVKVNFTNWLCYRKRDSLATTCLYCHFLTYLFHVGNVICQSGLSKDWSNGTLTDTRRRLISITGIQKAQNHFFGNLCVCLCLWVVC